MSFRLNHSVLGNPPGSLDSTKTDHRKRLRSPMLPASLSILQSEILRHICITPNATYKELMEQTHSNRITVVYSVESLIDHNYINKQKVNPNRKKSKLVLLPTIKGISYACTYLELKIGDLIITNKDEITTYIELVREAFHSSAHKKILEPLFNTVLHEYPKPERENAEYKKELVKYSFLKGLLEMLQHNTYNAQNFFNDKVIEWLKHVFSTTERKKMKDDFNTIGNNFTVAIQQFPD